MFPGICDRAFLVSLGSKNIWSCRKIQTWSNRLSFFQSSILNEASLRPIRSGMRRISLLSNPTADTRHFSSSPSHVPLPLAAYNSSSSSHPRSFHPPIRARVDLTKHKPATLRTPVPYTDPLPNSPQPVVASTRPLFPRPLRKFPVTSPSTLRDKLKSETVFESESKSASQFKLEFKPRPESDSTESPRRSPSVSIRTEPRHQASSLHGWTDPAIDAWATTWSVPRTPNPLKGAEDKVPSTPSPPPPHLDDFPFHEPFPTPPSPFPPHLFITVPRIWPNGRLSTPPELPHPPATSTPDTFISNTRPYNGGPSPPPEQQRTPEWFAKREGRLTASAFANALGLWPGGRAELWADKCGMGSKFEGNAATRWGTNAEPKALSCYETVTGNEVKALSFQVYNPDDRVENWLGASPDGLLQSDGFGQAVGSGVLEVKCPYNKGFPHNAPLPTRVPSYYVPQVQGLLEILDRDWLDFFIWTVNGSVVFRMERDPRYWNLIFPILSEYWWSNVVPARHLVKYGEAERTVLYAPREVHPLTSRVREENIRLARAARTIWVEESGVVKQATFG